MHLDIKLLGRLEATLDDIPIIPSAAKPQQVLALLAVRASHVVSTSTILEELWGNSASLHLHQQPPPRAGAGLWALMAEVTGNKREPLVRWFGRGEVVAAVGVAQQERAGVWRRAEQQVA